MATPDSPQTYDNIDKVPRGEPFRLAKPLVVDKDTVGKPGEYVLVAEMARLPLTMRTALLRLKEISPQAAQIAIRTHNLVTLALFESQPSDGPGEVSTSGTTSVTPGPRLHVLPDPITVESVPPATVKANELLQDWPIVLAASYMCINRDGKTSLVKMKETDFPSPDLAGGLVLENFLPKGTSFTLAEDETKERGSPLLLKKSGDDTGSILIDPNCELEVYALYLSAR